MTQQDAKRPLRLMFYDNTCTGLPGLPGLTHSWWLGGYLYRMLGRIDEFIGVSNWEEALTWLADVQPGSAIEEIQYWGHGRWGCIYIDRVALDATALREGHPWFPLLAKIRARMSGHESLWWFRTCETFGADKGQDFAKSFATFMGCRAAGHTFIIGPWQSGLHCLGPGQEPHWDSTEGIAKGAPDAPEKALWSWPFRPHTITCFHGQIPAAWDHSHLPLSQKSK